MGIYFVRKDISPREAQYRAGKGDLQRLVKGVYIDADDDPEEMTRRHAARIAKFIYPSTYLARESAWLRGATPGGVVWLNGGSRYHSVIGGIDFRVRKGPTQRDVQSVTWRDSKGEFVIKAASPLQSLLEILDDGDLTAAEILADITARLETEYGSLGEACAQARKLARRMSLQEAGDKFEDIIKSEMEGAPEMDRTLEKYMVAWHKDEIVGQLEWDGQAVVWKPVEGWIVPFSPVVGELPPFLNNLMAEGSLKALVNESDIEALRNSRRLMSNISIAPTVEEIEAIPEDYLSAPLALTCDPEGGFSGTIGNDLADLLNGTTVLEAVGKIAELIESHQLPTISGAQIKVPVSLDRDGMLRTAVGRPFTHILKLPPPGTMQFEAMEWVGAEMARAAGLPAAASAPIELPGETPMYGLLVERFDIRAHRDDDMRLYMEDLTVSMGLTANQKDKTTWEEMADAIRDRSTSREEDMEALLRRAVLSWVFGDGDCHAKNLGLLHEHSMTMSGDQPFRSVRLAPAYDVTTSMPFGASKCIMALPLNDKRSDLTREDFLFFAQNSLKMKKGAAEDIIEEVCLNVAAELDLMVTSPAKVLKMTQSLPILEKVRDMAVARARGLGVEVEQALAADSQVEEIDAPVEAPTSPEDIAISTAEMTL